MSDALPSVGELVAPIIEKVEPDQRPLLIALAERIAARRYLAWANATDNPANRDRLVACAAREEEIARRVESLFPEASTVQSELLARHGGLEAAYCELFEGRPLADQFSMQSQGERLGAATWRALAGRSEDEVARDTYLECAQLEEQNAVVLEELTRAGG